MTFPAGTRLGAYEVLDPLGTGGMGEVYRARDTRLQRHVALKILPEAFALDPDRLARFTREAQTLAALNHPNIASIYGIEESQGVTALVMELVEGEELFQRVARGAMPLDEALPIARQMADALEAAHESGIVHRDLKPANVKVRSDGTVKVLDFGLAKTFDPSGPGAAGRAATLANSPTFTSPAMTAMGVVLGTAAYMSPEQARGAPVDRRADIWAFGVVLYEMLSGTRLFQGESVAETLGLIFSHEPDLAKLPAGTPPSIRELIARCMMKDPKRRLRDIGDARLQIEDVLGDISGAHRPATVPPPALRRRGQWRPWVAVPLVAAAAAAAGWLARPDRPAPTLRLSIALPSGDQATTIPSISGDGRLVAYAAGRTAATSQLYLRPLGDFAARVVANSVGAEFPFFSPDGRTVAFFAGGKLRRASVDGGGTVDIASAPTPWGGTWDGHGRIVFTKGLGSGLWRVSADGGTPEELTKPDGAAAGYAHVFPQRLPGTDDLLLAFWGRTFYSARLPADSVRWREITVALSAQLGVGIYARGFLLSHDGMAGVVAARWDPATTTPVRPGTPVLERVHWGLNSDWPWISVAENGTAVYVPGTPHNRHLVWVDRQGHASALPGDADLIYQAALSHDGRRVVYGHIRSQWVVDLSTGARTRLISDVSSWHGAWLPGDERIVVTSLKDGEWDLHTIASRGGELRPLLKRPYVQHVQAVGGDGSMVFLERHPVAGSDLWTLTPDGVTVPLVVTPYNETSAAVSPDGRFVAYVSDDSGRNEVFATPAVGQGAAPRAERVQISIGGGTGPVWSRDGRELFYRADDALISVQVRTTGTLVLGERKKLLDLSDYDSGYLHEFDVSPDGQRFLVIRTEPESRPLRLDIIINWIDELKKKVG
jgi:eukaryotic-like serine/threonine-protein kinase